MVAASARRAVLPALLALAALLALPHAASAALTWKSCVDFDSARCATLDVPLDRAGVDPGTVPLRIARIGHTSGPTLMYLSGGPGGAGVSEMLQVIDGMPQLARRYRVIGYDQRGTGRSGLLRCPKLEKDPHLRSTTAAAECAASLGVARHHYTTPDSVQDMEAIRQQLGVDKLTLFGISYGTELALEYARTFPTHVARLIIDSVVDPDDPDPFFTTGFRAMTPTLQALCPLRCEGIAADPVGDLAKLVAATRIKPLAALTYDSKGRSHKETISPTPLLDLMFQADYAPQLRAALPAAVTAALASDGAPLARLLREGDAFDELGSPRDFSNARYATICEETPLPWAAGTPIAQRPAAAAATLAAVAPGAFTPFDAPTAFEDEIDLCLRWPDVPRPPAATPAPPYPAVPTLILQGGEDLRTPPEGSARVAAKIPGAKRVVVPGVGHAVSAADPSGCGVKAILRFVAGQSVAATCRRVAANVPAVKAPPASFASLAGVTGLPRKVGRTVRAVAATYNDFLLAASTSTLSNSGGGLRGGSWEVHQRGNETLRDFQAVPGVTVSGGGLRTQRLTVSGPSAAHGTLALSNGGHLTGRLGGKRINLQFRTTRAAAARAGTLPAIARTQVLYHRHLAPATLPR